MLLNHLQLQCLLPKPRLLPHQDPPAAPTTIQNLATQGACYICPNQLEDQLLNTNSTALRNRASNTPLLPHHINPREILSKKPIIDPHQQLLSSVGPYNFGVSHGPGAHLSAPLPIT